MIRLPSRRRIIAGDRLTKRRKRQFAAMFSSPAMGRTKKLSVLLFHYVVLLNVIIILLMLVCLLSGQVKSVERGQQAKGHSYPLPHQTPYDTWDLTQPCLLALHAEPCILLSLPKALCCYLQQCNQNLPRAAGADKLAQKQVAIGMHMMIQDAPAHT